MKKIFFIAALMLISITSFANTKSDLKANVREIRNSIAAYVGNESNYRHIKSTPVMYDKEIEMTYIEFECPAIWKNTTDYVAHNISTVMNQYANIAQVGDWCYDDEMVFCEYRCKIDDNNYYIMMVNYYRMSNVLEITMYEPIIGA